jgi:putative ABC transport system permease protein
MPLLRYLYAFWRNLAHKDRVDQELEEEVRSYAEMLAEEKIETGASPEQARREAKIELGGIQQVKEQARQVRIGAWLETGLQDVRYGLRVLRKSPGFTMATVLTLALGIGANATMFSSIDSLVLHPLAFSDPDRLVAVSETQRRTGFEPENVAPADFVDWAKQSTVFTSMAAYQGWDADLTGRDEPEHLHGARVSPGFFSILGVGTALGRTFAPEEDQPGSDRVAVISYGLWKRRFSGDPHVLNADIDLNGSRFKLVGVMPAEFNFPLSTELWTPLPHSNELIQERDKQSLFTLARLGPGASTALAQAEMTTIAARLEQLHPKTNAGRRVSVKLLREQVAGEFTPTFLWMGLGSVLFVLLIACVNVANMQLARAAARQKEMAVRSSLGATRRRIMRQLLTENVVLALMGGSAGIAIAWLLLRFLKAGMPAELVRLIAGWQAMTIDARTLGFTFAIALLTGIVFGLAPALAVSRSDLTEALKKGEKGSILGGARHRLRSLLVIFELALALVLLVGAGLMVKGFRQIVENQRQGFNPEGLLTLGVTVSQARYPENYRITAFYQESLDSISKLPQVISTSAVAYVPASGAWSTEKVFIEGRPGPAPGESQTTNFQIVAPRYFQTMRIPLLQGRDFTGGDNLESLKVAIVSAEFVRRYFPGVEPLGQRIRVSAPPADWLTIVGVAGDVKRFMFDRGMRPMVYLPHLQEPARTMHLVVRTRGDPLMLASAIRAQVLKVDKEQPVFDVKTIETIIQEQISGVRVGAISMSFYGLLALLLSAVGVYGLVAYSVEQRAHEIGIRMALGAKAQDILRLVLAKTIKLTVIGLGFGLLGAFAMSRGMAKAMFGAITLDLTTFSLFTLLLACVALVASYVPAHRATRVNAMVTLRNE